MKRKLLIILIITMVVFTGTGVVLGLNGYFGGGVDSADTTRGLVGYWAFEEGSGTTANDSSGNGNDGTLTSMDPPTDWVSGKAGNGGALDFDGTNDHVSVGTMGDLGSLLGSQSVSVTAWVKSSKTTPIDILGTKNTGTNTLWRIQLNKDAALGNLAGGINLFLRGEAGASDRLYGGVNSDTGVTDGNWHYVVAQSDPVASSIEIYVDAVQQTVVITDSPIGSTANFGFPLFIGAINDEGTADGLFDGQIDEVRIYDRALSASEIRYLYNKGGPVAHYKMDEGSGTTAFDSTNITNDGTITGATYVTGQYGTALDFDGSDDEVNVTNADPIDFDVGLINAVTFSAWINADTDGEGDVGRIIEKRTATFMRVDTESAGKLDLEASLDLVTTDATLNVSGILSTNTWHHVAMTYEDDADDEISLYVDGVLVGTSTNGDGAPAATDTAALIIGGDNSTTANFDGTIDDVRIYNYARTAEEIRADYNAGFAARFGGSPNQDLTRGLVGYWNFEEGSGTNANDSSDLNNDGTLTNMDPNTDWVVGNAVARTGGALDFDGSDDFVDLGNPAVWQWDDDTTAAIWFKPNADMTSESGRQDFFTKTNAWWLFHNVQAVNCSVGALTFGIGSSCSDPQVSYVTNFDAGTWYHIAGTLDKSAGIARLYINGFEVASQTGVTQVMGTANDIEMGSSDAQANFFNGVLDEEEFALHNFQVSSLNFQ